MNHERALDVLRVLYLYRLNIDWDDPVAVRHILHAALDAAGVVTETTPTREWVQVPF